MLTRACHARYMAWLAAHGPRQFSMRQWRQVFFTDESRFTLFRPDGQRRGERFADACVLERDRFGGWLGSGLGGEISRIKVALDCDNR